jgi:hypothetical protein
MIQDVKNASIANTARQTANSKIETTVQNTTAYI